MRQIKHQRTAWQTTKSANIGENIHQVGWFGDRCLFWYLHVSKLFMTKFYESNILTVAKIVWHVTLKLVIPISRFPKKNILAYTEECKDFVKLYRFKTGDNFEKRCYKLVNIDFRFSELWKKILQGSEQVLFLAECCPKRNKWQVRIIIDTPLTFSPALLHFSENLLLP